MTVTHPVAERDGNGHPSGYTYDGVTYHIDGDGVIDCPTDLEDEIRDALADHYDVERSELDGDDVELCGEEMSDGSTCDRPADDCQYHGD